MVLENILTFVLQAYEELYDYRQSFGIRMTVDI